MRWLLVSFVWLVASPASAHCTLTGAASLIEVSIDVPGTEPLVADLEDQPLRVRMTGEPRLRFRATGALDFSGSVARDAVPVALRRPTRVGPLTLRPGTAIERAVGSADHLTVSARLSDAVRAELELPCAAARLGATGVPPDDLPADAPAEGGLEVEAGRLRVHRAPASPGSAVVVVESGSLRLAELGRRDGWVHVRRDFFDGATIDGWVRAGDVRVVEPEGMSETLMGTHIGMTGGCGHGGSHIYVGPATLRRGATLRVTPGGSVWARARRDLEVEVFWRWGAPWVTVEGLEGLRSRRDCPTRFSDAHARREDVVIPSH